MAEYEYDADIQRGDRGGRARLVQEWLSLHGVGAAIDGRFGQATEGAVGIFQRERNLAVTGVVDRTTFDALVEPMRKAMQPLAADGRSLGQLLAAAAQQQAMQRPLEVGGPNGGPWVRLYMGGNEGAAWPWCAGFVFHCLRMACTAAGVPPPLPRTYSCDVLAMSAKAKGMLLNQPTSQDRARIQPGSIFLVRRTATDWVHTGIVTGAGPTSFGTIEGNTNDAGDREGYAVCARVRAYGRNDFVLV